MRAIHKQVSKATPAPRVHAPSGQNMCRTKTEKLVKLLKKQWVTPAVAFTQVGLLSLSQRVGELIREGVKVQKKWHTTKGGTRVMSYRVTP